MEILVRNWNFYPQFFENVLSVFTERQVSKVFDLIYKEYPEIGILELYEHPVNVKNNYYGMFAHRDSCYFYKVLAENVSSAIIDGIPENEPCPFPTYDALLAALPDGRTQLRIIRHPDVDKGEELTNTLSKESFVYIDCQILIQNVEMFNQYNYSFY